MLNRQKLGKKFRGLLNQFGVNPVKIITYIM